MRSVFQRDSRKSVGPATLSPALTPVSGPRIARDSRSNMKFQSPRLNYPVGMRGAVGHDFGRVDVLAGANVSPSGMTVGRADDPQERSADAMAENLSSSHVQTTSRIKAGVGTKSREGPPVGDSNGGRKGGQPLPESARDFFEARLGHDFGRVRVHNDERAARLAEGLGARAFAAGDDLVFGAGEYAPDTFRGQRLLAHELAHVVQHRESGGASERATIRRKGDEEGLVAMTEVTTFEGVPIPHIVGMTRDAERYLVDFEGETHEVTPERYAEVKRMIIDYVRTGPAVEVAIKLSSVESRWRYFDEERRAHPVTTRVSEAFDLNFEGMPERSIVDEALEAMADLEGAIAEEDFGKTLARLVRTESAVNWMIYKMNQYTAGLMEGSSTAIATLEVTKALSFAAATALGGGALVGAGAVSSTVAAGAISSGAFKGIESGATSLGEYISGKDVSPTDAILKALEAASIGAVTAAIAGPLADKIKGYTPLIDGIYAVVGRGPIVDRVGEETLKRGIAAVLGGASLKTLKGSLEDTLNAISGRKEVTLSEFIEHVVHNLVIGGVTGGLADWAKVNIPPEQLDRTWLEALQDMAVTGLESMGEGGSTKL